MMIGDTRHFFQKLYSHTGCGLMDPKRVTVAQGIMRGSTMTSGKGRPFCSFRGIPYAPPPLGKFRFKPPREPQPWRGVLDASSEMATCVNYMPMIGSVSGEEDCLYLSVFTPTLIPPEGQLLNVMVWISPGEYYFEMTNTFLQGPHYLMDENVIVVYVSYRIGVLGFLSTGDDEAPGNYGMKDQVAALRWVKNNIAAFGGNASGITLFGQSAGAASCHLHMLSPLSRGLFHRVISMGGTAVNPWARCPNPLEVAKKQAHIVGCPTNSTADLVSCLRETDAKELYSTIKYLFVWWNYPSPGYAPVVEKKTERNPKPFMSEEPLELMRTGKFEQVPWLMGGTSMSIAFAFVPIIELKVLRSQFNQLLSHNFLPKLMMMEISTTSAQITNLTEKIAAFYMGTARKITSSNYQHMMDMFSDRLLIHGRHKAAQLHSLAAENQTIYIYNFAYKSLYSMSTLTSFHNYGATHGDELLYIFKYWGGPTYPPDHPDLEVRDLLITLLTNFAKYGNPTPSVPTGNYLVDELRWLPIGQTNPNHTHLCYLNIGQEKIPGAPSKYLDLGLGYVKLQMAVDLYKERMDFWDSLPLNENYIANCEQHSKMCSTGETGNKMDSYGTTRWNAQFTSLLVLTSIQYLL